MSEDETKEALSDYSEIFTTRYDDIKEIPLNLRDAFVQMNTFYSRESEGKHDVYQYLQKHQYQFIAFQQVISASLEAVYPVLRDINELFVIHQSQLEKQATSSTTTPTSVVGSPNITIQPQPQRSFFSMFSRQKPQQESLPRSLEDAWTMTKEMHITTLNVPNLWQKFLDWHYKGVMRQEMFQTGMVPYLRIERWYFNAIIEPLVTKMVQHAVEIIETKHMATIKEAYTQTMASNERIEQTKAFAGSMGGGGFPQQKPNP